MHLSLQPHIVTLSLCPGANPSFKATQTFWSSLETRLGIIQLLSFQLFEQWWCQMPQVQAWNGTSNRGRSTAKEMPFSVSSLKKLPISDKERDLKKKEKLKPHRKNEWGGENQMWLRTEGTSQFISTRKSSHSPHSPNSSIPSLPRVWLLSIIPSLKKNGALYGVHLHRPTNLCTIQQVGWAIGSALLSSGLSYTARERDVIDFKPIYGSHKALRRNRV